jgi:hypothetical protein
MELNFQDFVLTYRVMGDMELLELAQSYDLLREVAKDALRAEFAVRKLDPPIIEQINVPTNRKLVTVSRYRDLSEAIVARSLLESAGIGAYLCDENLVRLEWQISNTIGGIRLQVDVADEAAAKDILAQPTPLEIAFGEPLDFLQPRCPRCDSIDLTFEGSSRALALASVTLLSLPLPLGPRTWCCNACGARWEDDQEDPGIQPGVV